MKRARHGGDGRRTERAGAKRSAGAATDTPRRIVSEAFFEAARKQFCDAVRARCQQRRRAVKALAAEIGLTRQGLTKVLRRQTGMSFTTFLRACFLWPEDEGEIAVKEGGCHLQVRWTIGRGEEVSSQGNNCCLSPHKNGR